MLQEESILLVADNSGAKKLLVIKCLGGSKRRYGRIGDLVIATVKKADPHSENVKKGQVVMALIVATKRSYRRRNNTWIKFSKNYAVLVKKDSGSNNGKEPVGTRLFVPLISEFNDWGFKKLFSLAPEIL